MREFIERFDICFYPLVVWILLVLNRSAARMRPRATPLMGWSAATAFLAAVAFGYQDFQPANGMALFAVLVCAGIVAGVAALAVFVICPPILAATDGIWSGLKRRADERRWARDRAEREREQQRADEREERQRQDERVRDLARLEWQRNNPPPPPPTREQLAAAAKTRYDATLAMIAQAGFDETVARNARLDAEQHYMRELEGIWKRS